MRVLLDTNIIIHRESHRVFNEDIGTLFHWLDRLRADKCIHPLSIDELKKNSNKDTVSTFMAKLRSYIQLKTVAPDSKEIIEIRAKYDQNKNDNIDTSLLNEVHNHRVDFLITEDRKIHKKAKELNTSNKVFTIDQFLEKAIAENPELTDYNILSIRKKYFGQIGLESPFFDSFRGDYEGFDRWFNRKADEESYVCLSENNDIFAFLYLKIEGKDESYNNIDPVLEPKKRLKIGTFKVVSNGYKLGERFLRIIFDNAIKQKVDEIYVTLFNKTEEHMRLIGLLSDWGFYEHGIKKISTGDELVFVRNLRNFTNNHLPKLTYPFVIDPLRYFIVPIYPDYHTELLPDSILNNESPMNYVESEPHRNAIQKVYISRSQNKNLKTGDLILFYRTKTPGTSAYYTSVLTTIGVVDNIYKNIDSEKEFINLCRKRSVFSDDDLRKHWNYKPIRPFVVNFLYLYSLPKKLNLKSLINLGVIPNVNSAPRGFEAISREKFQLILKESNSDESIVIHKA